MNDDTLFLPGLSPVERHDIHARFDGGALSELRACFRTLGYFTPVHERGTKWENIEEHIRTILKRVQLIGFMKMGQPKAVSPRSLE
jgi:hypothetical protein